MLEWILQKKNVRTVYFIKKGIIWELSWTLHLISEFHKPENKLVGLNNYDLKNLE